MQKYFLGHQDTSTQAWQFASSIHFTTVVKSPGFGQGLFLLVCMCLSTLEVRDTLSINYLAITCR